jgi:hypothetical protein
MSKKDYKRYVKKFNNRSAKIPWKYYRKIIEEEYNAVESERSHSAGSKRSFTIGDNIVFVLHKPHGKKDDYVGKYDHHNVLDLLKSRGLLKDEENSEKK